MTCYSGVMRFLQTEWHKHERDRNAWEIERQEMKSRIARLEGSNRKADQSLKTSKRYIQMLEKSLRERDAKLKAQDPTRESVNIEQEGKKETRRKYSSRSGRPLADNSI